MNYEQGYNEAVVAFCENDFETAYKIFETLNGYKDSYFYLGSLAYNNYGDKTKNNEFISVCFDVAMKKGCAKAFFGKAELLNRYAADKAGATKYAEAGLNGLKKEALEGDTMSQYILGTYYLSVHKERMAFECFEQSAAKGFAPAEYTLSQMYEEGIGAEQDDEKAVRLLESAAYKNYGDAQFALGYRYSCGKGVPKDEDMSFKLYQMAAQRGIGGAMYNLALWYERAYESQEFFKACERAALSGHVSAMLKLAIHYGEEKSKDLSAAHMWLLEADEKGSLAASYLLGEQYESGEGAVKDLRTAVGLFEKAALNGYVPAMSKLGFLYKSEEAVMNPARSLYWNQKAASSSDPQALCNLGLSYEFGNGVEIDLKKAFELYKRSAELNYDRGIYNLAYCYANGLGTDKNAEKAAEYFEKAALCGHVNAMYNIGVAYLSGSGVAKDLVKAVEWFYKGASNNHAESVFYLGYCHMNGLGVRANYEKAVSYYEKAAEMGDAEAMFNLGYCYYNGKGVAVNKLKARQYFMDAAALGQEYAAEVLQSFDAKEIGKTRG